MFKLRIISISKSHQFNILGYISTETPGSFVNEIPILGNIDFYKMTVELHKAKIHIAIGENSVRYNIYISLGKLRKNVISIIFASRSRIAQGI